jgi:PAS domain S-box-containing protein
MNEIRTLDKRRFAQEVEARFGLMPNFFCTATAAPGLIDELWTFAKSAYLDSPLPSLFKERLFVYLSRFCAVRYCIVRHVGFLIGEGRPAGDASALPETIEQVIALLTRPAPGAKALEQALSRLEALSGPANIPVPRTELESDLFDALTIVFLEPRLSERARNAVRRAFGEKTFETLAAYLAFIRTAHYWTETHPELAYEPDVAAVMQRCPDLAALLLDDAEAKPVAEGEALRQALAELTQKLRKSEEGFRELLGALPAAIFVTDTGGRITYYNQAAVELWGRRPELGKDRWSDLARPCSADGKPANLKDCPTEIALRHGKAVRGLEAMLERADGTRIPVIPYPTPLRDTTGTIVGVVNMTVDISERQQAERTLAERNAQLALAGRAALVGSYAYHVNAAGQMQISEGYAAIHGLPQGTTETTMREWRARVHPEDLARVEGFREQMFADRQKEYTIEYRIVRPDGEVRWIERRSSISYGGNGGPKRIVGVSIDVTDRKRAEQQQRAMNAELDHRVKNVLATVSAIIAQTQEASSSRADFVTGLNSRINSLARTHELLSKSNWRGASLEEIVRREFAPYTRGNTEATGPGVTLKAEATQAVATVLHELATNAAKYGALSSRSGRVSVRWRWLQNGSHDPLVIEWQETGGPPVLAPSQSGYGTGIIRELIPFELGGAVELSFSPEGTRCRLEIPGEWICTGRQRAEEDGILDSYELLTRRMSG